MYDMCEIAYGLILVSLRNLSVNAKSNVNTIFACMRCTKNSVSVTDSVNGGFLNLCIINTGWSRKNGTAYFRSLPIYTIFLEDK